MVRRGVLGGSKVLTSGVVDVETLEGSVAPAQFEACAAVPRFPRVAGGLLDECPTMNVNLKHRSLRCFHESRTSDGAPVSQSAGVTWKVIFLSLRGDEDSASMLCAFIQGVCKFGRKWSSGNVLAGQAWPWLPGRPLLRRTCLRLLLARSLLLLVCLRWLLGRSLVSAGLPKGRRTTVETFDVSR